MTFSIPSSIQYISTGWCGYQCRVVHYVAIDYHPV